MQTLDELFERHDLDEPFLTISKVAHYTGLHPQTIRQYDRIGLIKPRRTKGLSRRYSVHDIEHFLQIKHMSQKEGINLSGISRIIALEKENYYLKVQLKSRQANTIFEASSVGHTQLITKYGRRKNRREFFGFLRKPRFLPTTKTIRQIGYK